MKATKSHAQTHGQVEGFDQTIVSIMRYYVAKHREYWHEIVLPFNYAYSAPVH